MPTSADLRLAAAATGFEAEDRYHHNGRSYSKGQHAQRFVQVEPDYPEIVGELAQCLYDRFYIQPHPGNGGAILWDPMQGRDFQQELAAANHTSSSLSEGWSVVAERGHGLLVSRPGGEEALVRRSDFLLESSGQGKVRRPASHFQKQQGYFYVLGENDIPFPSTGQETRFYFHLCRQGAPRFVASLSKHLNAARVPFRAKVLSDPQLYRRADSGVLYLRRADVPHAMASVRAVWHDVHPYLCRTIPRFTKPLWPGLGVSEGPGRGESFGMHRCRLVAEGLWLARDRGAAEGEGRLRVVEAHVRDVGLDPDRLYLQGGHDDIY